MLIRITAPHFVAGIVLGEGKIAIRCAPIVGYMQGWTLGRIVKYVKAKGWTGETVSKTP